MGYLRFVVPSTGTINGVKYIILSSEQAQADDRYDIVTPGGQLLEIDEAEDASLWTAAGAVFSTTGIEGWEFTTPSLTTGFPDTSHTSIYSDTTKSTVIAGASVSLGEGAYSVNYNNDTEVTPYRLHLHVPTILSAIDTLASSVINCQCDCSIDAPTSQKYIKARAYLDLITYKATNATNEAGRAEVQTMLTTLTDFLKGTNELCGSC